MATFMFSRLRGHVSINETYGTIEKERNSQQKTNVLLRFFFIGGIVNESRLLWKAGANKTHLKSQMIYMYMML